MAGSGSVGRRAVLEPSRATALPDLTAEVVVCRKCPRLVAWRELVAREKVARFRDETYWGRPVPGFGDPAARLLIVRPGGILEDQTVRDLPELLRPGDALVVNDTRVIPARLTGRPVEPVRSPPPRRARA